MKKGNQSGGLNVPQALVKCYLVLLALLLTCYRICATFVASETLQPHGGFPLTTNWVAQAKEALPPEYSTQTLSFQEITNLLRQQSQSGNDAAQALWGAALIAQGGSRKAALEGLDLLRRSGTNGYVPAMLELGWLFKLGKHFDRDYAESLRWFTLASDKGNPEAQHQLGLYYHYGLGTAPDLALTAKYYRLSAEQTNYLAMKDLGYLFMSGIGVKKDLQQAKSWLLRAANEGGSCRAMFNLGVLSSELSTDTNSLADAFHWYQKSADLGDPLGMQALAALYYNGCSIVETNLDNYRYWRFKAATSGATDSQYLMAFAYLTGDGVPIDPENSLAWLRKAAAKNHPRALYDLAFHYLQDKTNPASQVLANRNMERAAQGGHREAQFQCAMACFRGDVAPPNFEDGKRWLAMAAENAWAKAEFRLFQLYYSGLQPAPECPRYPQDKPQAITWLRRAADHDYLEAQHGLGVMMIQGRDVETNRAEAEKLLRNAAEHGNPSAQNDFGFAILQGYTKTFDFIESAMWCQLAASQSTDPNLARRASVNLTNALSRITPAQRPEVDKRVKAFQLRPVPKPDPMVKGWEKNPSYAQEDGLLGH